MFKHDTHARTHTRTHAQAHRHTDTITDYRAVLPNSHFPCPSGIYSRGSSAHHLMAAVPPPQLALADAPTAYEKGEDARQVLESAPAAIAPEPAVHSAPEPAAPAMPAATPATPPAEATTNAEQAQALLPAGPDLPATGPSVEPKDAAEDPVGRTAGDHYMLRRVVFGC